MVEKTVFSIRVSEDLKQKLEALAVAMDRDRSWVVSNALETYVAEQSWQIQAIEEGIAAAERGELVSHDEVVAKWEGKLEDHLDRTSGKRSR